jgi:hypothetical protein
MKNVKMALAILLLPVLAQAQDKQDQKVKKERKGEFYFAWGYNKEWYTNSDVHVSQPSLGNDYTMTGMTSHDNPGWDKDLFKKPISIPQYSYRLGYFFNKKKNLGFEINFDHTKHILTDGQTARVVGTLGGRAVDTSVLFSKGNGFNYYLNNGANFLLFNIVKRWKIYESLNGNLKVDFLGKAGIGPVIPHVENTLFGKANKDGFQLGGWNVGAEGAIRATFYKHVFLEYASKVDYARYSGLKVYEGKAKEAFGSYIMILSLGYTFQAGKKI